MKTTSELKNLLSLINLGSRLLLKGKITIKKLKNLVVNISNAILRRPEPGKYPSVLVLDPTNICNLGCPFCRESIKGQLSGKMEFADFKKIIDEAHEYLVLVFLYWNGEPFCHPHIYEMIEYAGRKKIGVILSTNGHFFETQEKAKRLIKSGLDTLIVSISGTSQEIYQKYHRGGNLETVLSGIRRITRAKGEMRSHTPQIVLRYIIFKHNICDLVKIRPLAKELKVDRLELRPTGTWGEKYTGELPQKPRYSRYKLVNGKIVTKRVKNHCYSLWLIGVIDWDGTVAPCCMSPYFRLKMGDTKSSSLREIWSGQTYKKFRRQVLNDKRKIPKCAHCNAGVGYHQWDYFH